MAGPSDDLVGAVRASAARLGVDPSDLLTAMSYETGGKLDPNLWGGKGNNHLGLIQFGPEERAKYGVKPGMAAADQVVAAENFLRDRGVKPGHGLLDIYSTINAGRPGLYGRSDAANGGAPGTVSDKVASMAGHRMRANSMLGIEGDAPGASAAPASAPAAAGPAPFGLAPTGGGAPADDGMAAIMAALGAVPQSAAQDEPVVAPPPIHYQRMQALAMPELPGLRRARVLSRAMSRV